MPYSNSWKISAGSTITVNGKEYFDCQEFSAPGEDFDIIDITNIGSTIEESVASDIKKLPEISFVIPQPVTKITCGGAAVSCSVSLAKLSKTISFSAIVKSAIPEALQKDGKMGLRVTLKPTTAPTYS